MEDKYVEQAEGIGSEAQKLIAANKRGEVVTLIPHAVAAFLPPFGEPEMAELVEDIRVNGLRRAITLHPDGTVLDGNARAEACKRAGAQLELVEWTGPVGTEVAFVTSENINRRHWKTASQKAMYISGLKTWQAGRPRNSADLPNLTIRQAALALDVSERSIGKANVIKENAPENIKKLVLEGALSLDDGVAVAKATGAVKERIKGLAPEQAVKEAKAAPRAQRTRKRSLQQAVENFREAMANAKDEDKTEFIDWLKSAEGEECRSMFEQLLRITRQRAVARPTP